MIGSRFFTTNIRQQVPRNFSLCSKKAEKFVFKSFFIPSNFDTSFSNSIFEPLSGLQVRENPELNLFYNKKLVDVDQLEPSLQAIAQFGNIAEDEKVIVYEKGIANLNFETSLLSKFETFNLPWHTDLGFFKRCLMRRVYQLPENISSDEIIFPKNLKPLENQPKSTLFLSNRPNCVTSVNLAERGVWFNPSFSPHRVSVEIPARSIAFSRTLTFVK